MDNRLFDKETLSNNSNSRLFDRNNIFIENNDEDSQNNSNIRIKKKSTGEITGCNLNIQDYESHLPMRSAFSQKSENIDQNSYLDFKLFEKDIEINTNVEYNDTNDGNYSLINSKTTNILKNSDSNNIFLENLSNINIFLFNNIFKNYQNSFNINGLGLYFTFGNLFLGSSGNSEIELKQYFNFINKNLIKNIINKNIKKFNLDFNLHIEYNSYILTNKNVLLSSNYKYFSNKCSFLSIDRDNLDFEVEKINNIIKNDIGFNKLISKNTLKNVDLSIINVISINPKFDFNIEKIVINKFMGFNTPFLKFSTNIFPYYEDNNNSIIEIPCVGRKLSFGIVNTNLDNIDNLETCISKFKLVKINSLLIPKIVKRQKNKLNSVLFNTNLKTIFLQTNLEDIYPEKDCQLNNIIQYCDLILEENKHSNNKNNFNKYENEIDNLIINNSFIYYMRYLPTNTILNIGYIN